MLIRLTPNGPVASMVDMGNSFTVGELRYATTTRVVHVAIAKDGCGYTAKCGAYLSAYSGGMPHKVCKRCVPRDQLAIAVGLVTFVAWAASFAPRDYFGTCDKCDGPNDRANESNYCTGCSAAFQARTLLNPECQPVGSR